MLAVMTQLARIEANLVEMDAKLDAIQESLYELAFRQLDEKDPYGLDDESAA